MGEQKKLSTSSLIIITVFLLLALLIKRNFRPDFIDYFILNLNYYVTLAVILGFVVLLFLNLKLIKKHFSKIKKKTWLVLLVIFLFALVIRLFFIPHSLLVTDDEYFHANIARNMQDSQQNCFCDNYIDSECRAYTITYWPPGYQTILSLVFAIFPTDINTVFYFNTVIGALSVIIMFLVLYLILKDQESALFGAAFFAVIPIHLLLSGSGSPEVLDVFFLLLTLIAFIIYVRNQEPKTLLLLVFLLPLTMYLEIEFVFLVPLFGLFLILFDSKLKSKLLDSRFIAAVLLCFLLLTPVFYQIEHDKMIGLESYNDSIAQKMGYFKENIKDNLLFWVNNQKFPLIYSLLTLLGLVLLAWKREWKNIIFYSVFFLGIFIFYTAYEIGNFELGRSFRYTIYLYIPMLVCMTYLISQFRQVLIKHKGEIYNGMRILLIIVILFVFFKFQPYVNKYTLSQEKHDFLLTIAEDTQDDCIYAVANPVSLIETLHRDTIKLTLVYKTNLFDYAPCAYYMYKPYWERGNMRGDILQKYELEFIADSGHSLHGYYLYRLYQK